MKVFGKMIKNMEKGNYLKKKKNIYFEGKWMNNQKNGLFIVMSSDQEIEYNFCQYENGLFINEFVSKQQSEQKEKLIQNKFFRRHFQT